MGYGLLALQPLGEGYLSYGIVAGLMSAIVVLLACALLGGSAGLMYTPRSVVTLVMATVVLEGVARGPAAIAARGDVGRTLTLGLLRGLHGGAVPGALRRRPHRPPHPLHSFTRHVGIPERGGHSHPALPGGHAAWISPTRAPECDRVESGRRAAADPRGRRPHVSGHVVRPAAREKHSVNPSRALHGNGRVLRARGSGLSGPPRPHHRASTVDLAGAPLSFRLRQSPGRAGDLAHPAHPGR